ncbi:hypothetical protein HYFRA_00002477 [Hymenoscyphus fraxineus]|uniref:Uncharacterized protein n=1 Tax=Hymenoscyphus fraxineus TaxID=746836 RepID=A0A9N9L8B0_9HELO|nr:hypothetical protein HYFRA_00002477 [Hymenoscyphus fraxineus]
MNSNTPFSVVNARTNKLKAVHKEYPSAEANPRSRPISTGFDGMTILAGGPVIGEPSRSLPPNTGLRAVIATTGDNFGEINKPREPASSLICSATPSSWPTMNAMAVEMTTSQGSTGTVNKSISVCIGDQSTTQNPMMSSMPPPQSHMQRMNFPFKTASPSLRSLPSTDSFKSALSVQKEDELKDEVKQAVESIPHAYQTAIEVLENTVDEQTPRSRELGLATSMLKMQLQDGKAMISIKYNHFCKAFESQYICDFKEVGVKKLEMIGSTLLTDVVLNIHKHSKKPDSFLVDTFTRSKPSFNKASNIQKKGVLQEQKLKNAQHRNAFIRQQQQCSQAPEPRLACVNKPYLAVSSIPYPIYPWYDGDFMAVKRDSNSATGKTLTVTNGPRILPRSLNEHIPQLPLQQRPLLQLSTPTNPQSLWSKTLTFLQIQHPEILVSLTLQFSKRTTRIFAQKVVDHASKSLLYLSRDGDLGSKEAIIKSERHGTAEVQGQVLNTIFAVHKQIGLQREHFAWNCIWWLLVDYHKLPPSSAALDLRFRQLFTHIQDIVGIVARYAVLENIYIQNPTLSILKEYEDKMVDMCVLILQYFEKGFVFVENLGMGQCGVDELTELIEEIKKRDEVCRSFSVTIQELDIDDYKSENGSRVEEIEETSSESEGEIEGLHLGDDDSPI